MPLFLQPVIGQQDTVVSLALTGGLCQPIVAYCCSRIIHLSMGLGVGNSAAVFALHDVEGKRFSNGLFGGKWLLLVFHRHLN